MLRTGKKPHYVQVVCLSWKKNLKGGGEGRLVKAAYFMGSCLVRHWVIRTRQGMRDRMRERWRERKTDGIERQTLSESERSPFFTSCWWQCPTSCAREIWMDASGTGLTTDVEFLEDGQSAWQCACARLYQLMLQLSFCWSAYMENNNKGQVFDWASNKTFLPQQSSRCCYRWTQSWRSMWHKARPVTKKHTQKHKRDKVTLK